MVHRGPARYTLSARTIWRVFSVLSLALLATVIALSSLSYRFTPFLDTGVGFNGDRVQSVDARSPAAKAGLRVGDRFDPRTSFFDRLRAGTDPVRYGQTIRFRIVRNGTPRTIVLRATNAPNMISDAGIFVYPPISLFVLTFISIFAFILVGTALVLLRPNRMTWMFFLFCIGPSASYFETAIALLNLPMPLGFVLNMLRSTLLIVGLCAFIDFALRFPNDEVRGWRQRAERSLLIFFFLFLGFDYYSWGVQVYYAQSAWAANVWQFTNQAFLWLCELAVVAALLETYRRSIAQEKHRLRWGIAGALLGYTAVIFHASILGLIPTAGWVCFSLQTLSALAPFAIAYAVLKHRVIDIRFVINRAMVYGVVSAILVTLLASTYWLIGRVLQQTQLAAFLQLAAAIGIGISLLYTYKRIEALVNRWFFKPIYDAQEHLARVATTMLSAQSSEALEKLIATEPVSALDLASGALFRRRDGAFERVSAIGWSEFDNRSLERDDPLVLHLEAKRGALSLNDSRFSQTYLQAKTNFADEAVPIFSHGVLTAIALYGPHVNGTQIDPMERSAIEKLAAPAEQAYESLRVRLENVRRLSEILERVDDVAYDELHYYLADQAIDAIPEGTRTALIACAAIPAASAQDIAYATEGVIGVQQLSEIIDSSALVRKQPAGEFTVHPLIRHMLLKRFGAARRAMLIRAAQGWRENGNPGRAAELFWEAGMRGEAADELEQHYVASDVRAIIRADRYAAICAALAAHEVLSRPNLWLKRSVARMFQEEGRAAVREGQVVAEGASGLPVVKATFLRGWIAWMRIAAGELEHVEWLNQIDRSQPAALSVFCRLVQADAYGRSGKTEKCANLLKSANEAFEPFDEFAGIQAVIRACAIERIQGNCHEEQMLLDHATELFDGVHSRLALWSLSEAAIAAWLHRNDSALGRRASDLRERVERDDAPALMHLTSSLAGSFDEPNGIESPHHLVFAFLAQACNAEDSATALQYAERADAAATLAGEPFAATLSTIARAKFDSPRRLEHFARAVDWSERITSIPLRQAVRAIVLGDKDVGLLAPFVASLERPSTGAHETLYIQIASCSVTRCGEAIQISERETALAMAIARRAEPSTGVELAEMLWPNLDEAAGLRAVQTYVHRLRQRFADPEAIELTAQGYRFRPDIIVDLQEIEALNAALPSSSLDEFSRLVLSDATKRLAVGRPGYTIGWEWFAPIQRRIEELLRGGELRLAKDALQSGILDDALDCAKSILARDELDEGAWEVVIRCSIAAGDKAGASREFRRYREILRRELNEEPSATLAGLLNKEA